MKRFATTLVLGFGLVVSAVAQSLTILQPIDTSLLKNAHAIKRSEQSELIVQDIDKATFTSKQVYTILDEKGENFLSFYEWSDKFRKLDDVTITLLNAMGLPSKVYTKKDLTKDASSSGLVDDATLYYLNLQGVSYPTHIQFEYTVKYKGTLNYPDFDIQHPGEAIEQATYTATVPKKLGLRYFNQFTDIAPNKEEAGENITYTWKVNKLPAFEYEEGSVSWVSNFPRVLIAPNQFKMDDFAGDMSSWESFGKWYGNLATKSKDLSENTKTYLRSLVANTNDPVEKVRILYRYLQDNYRYVSIQLGIGGYRPFPASTTDTKKYGDCKALSNLMQASLAAVDIRSYQALVNAGDNRAPVDAAFPINAFNHVILCVPMPEDSIWLECTSNYTDFDKLGNFTENRKALLITENGGVLVNTPRSKAADNQLGSKDLINLSADGTGTIKTTLFCSGEYKFKFVHWLHNEYVDDQKRNLQYYLGFAKPAAFNLQWNDQIKSEIVETTFDLQVEKIPAVKAGPKMFLNKHPYTICKHHSLPLKEERTRDYYFENAFVKTDTTIYQLPTDYEVSSLPKPTHYSLPFASYDSETKLQADGNIISVSTLTLNKHIIPPAEYADTKKFFGQVIEDQNQKIVISKK